MTAKKSVVDPSEPVETKVEPKSDTSVNALELAQALTQAMVAAKGPEKKTAANRKPITPWTPKDGSPKLKLKRKMHQHGILIDEDMEDNETIALMNKLRPGAFLGGHVVVRKRRDFGIDITYPVKTASQRLKLVNQFGIRNFKELLERCIEEANNPERYEVKDYDA